MWNHNDSAQKNQNQMRTINQVEDAFEEFERSILASFDTSHRQEQTAKRSGIFGVELARMKQIREHLRWSAHENRSAVERLLERDQVRSRFAAMVGHDLSGLLSALGLHLGLVEQISLVGPLTPESLAPMRRGLDRCERLVRDLRTLGSVESDHFRLEPEECDLTTEIAECVHDFSIRLREKQIELLVLSPDRMPAVIDRLLIQQVLHNLLENAVHATPAGGTISVQARQGRDACEIEVTDTGTGILPEQLPRVFQPFERFSTKTSGSGLGLYICRRIMEAHGGTIVCQSAGLGRGTTFTLTLPPHVRRSLSAPGTAPKGGTVD